jgi:hypothetical protein
VFIKFGNHIKTRYYTVQSKAFNKINIKILIFFPSYRFIAKLSGSALTLQASRSCAVAADTWIKLFILNPDFCILASVSDPDPYWIGQWIRIRISIRNPDPDPEGLKGPTRVAKINKFHVLKCWMFSFED